MTVIKNKRSRYNPLENQNIEWRAAIYLRVSTFKQYQEGFSYEEQEKRLRELCERRGFKVVGIYGDPTVSGKELDKRKELQQMLDDIATGKVNVVVVWRLDRLVRGVENTQKIIKTAKKYGCRIVTEWNELDYNTPTGKYQINMDAAHGEYELDVISERTKMGMLGAIEKGHFPFCPFGFYKNKLSEDPKQIRVHESDMAWVMKLADWTLQGMSAVVRFEKFKKEYTGSRKLTRGVIEDMWNNELYIAKYRHKALELETGEECLYDLSHLFESPMKQETWEKLQKQKKKNQLTHRKKQIYIFMGKIKCPSCNHDVLGGTNGKGRNGVKHCYYLCTRCKKTGYIKETDLETLFIKEINEILDYFIIADIGTIPIRDEPLLVGDAKIQEENIKKLAISEQRIKNAYYSGFSSDEEFDRDMRAVMIKKENIKKEIAKITKRDIRIDEDMDISMYATIKEIKKRQDELYYARSNNIWEKLTKEERQQIVMEYVDYMEIELDENKVPVIKQINFRENKIQNLLFMFRNSIMDMTVKIDGKNILISNAMTRNKITEYMNELKTYYKVNSYELEIDDLKFDKLDQNKVVKIMPQLNTTKLKKQKFTIITV